MSSATRYQSSLSHYLYRGPRRPREHPWTGDRLCFEKELSGRSANPRHTHATYPDGRRFVFSRSRRLRQGFPPPAYLLLVTILISLITFPVYAQEGFEVEDNRVEADFPESVTFDLSIGGPALIEQIELEYGTTQVSCGPASAKARPEFEPDDQLKVSWTWDFRKSGSPPPGVRIWWRWHVRDEAGNQLDLGEEEFILEDARYDWSETRSDELVLFSALPDESVNQALWAAANQALERLEQEVGARPQGLVKLYNYPSTQDLHEARVYVHDWTGGLAISAYQTILLGVNQDSLEWGQRAVAHELAHIVIDQLTFNCLGDVPTWLEEGLATHIEGELSDYERAALDEALANDELLSLQSLSSSFPTSGKRADLAYAQSHQVVSYLLDTYGPERMADLLQTFKAGTTSDRALNAVYGLDTQRLDNEWRESLGLAPRQIEVKVTPTPPPTYVPYGAGTPLARAPTATPPPATATSSPVPTPAPTATPPPKATPTGRPTNPPLPAPTLTPAMLASEPGWPALALVAGGLLIVAALVAVLIGARRFF